ncbi:MAG: hypothetical protein AAFY15_11680 [Cyanobacteria bacterium J06648_11]
MAIASDGVAGASLASAGMPHQPSPQAIETLKAIAQVQHRLKTLCINVCQRNSTPRV